MPRKERGEFRDDDPEAEQGGERKRGAGGKEKAGDFPGKLRGRGGKVGGEGEKEDGGFCRKREGGGIYVSEWSQHPTRPSKRLVSICCV